MLKQLLNFSKELPASNLQLVVSVDPVSGNRLIAINAVRGDRQARVTVTEEVVSTSTAEVLLDWSALEMLDRELSK